MFDLKISNNFLNYINLFDGRTKGVFFPKSILSEDVKSPVFYEIITYKAEIDNKEIDISFLISNKYDFNFSIYYLIHYGANLENSNTNLINEKIQDLIKQYNQNQDGAGILVLRDCELLNSLLELMQHYLCEHIFSCQHLQQDIYPATLNEKFYHCLLVHLCAGLGYKKVNKILSVSHKVYVFNRFIRKGMVKELKRKNLI